MDINEMSMINYSQSRIKIMLLLLVSLLAAGCSEPYDDTDIRNQYKLLVSRVNRLEELCKALNNDVTSLKEIIVSLEKRDYIESVMETGDGDGFLSYTIFLHSGKALTIRNGRDGNDGKDGADAVFELGVRQYNDGIWYWTINGDWVIDEDGHRVVAVGMNGTDGKDGEDGQDGKDGKDGSDGKDGVTPQFRIVDEYWQVSYDDGQTWVSLGKAVGEDGKDGDDAASIFRDIDYSHPDFVIFTLADGTVIEFPKYKQLDLVIEEPQGSGMAVGSVRDIPYSIKGASEDVQIETVAEGVKATVIPKDRYSGIIRVVGNEDLDGEAKVLVFVVDNGTTIMRKLIFEDRVLTVEEGAAREVSYLGGEVSLNVMTNTDFVVIVPDEASSWVSVSQDTKAAHSVTVRLFFEENQSVARAVTLNIKDVYSDYSLEYTVLQHENPDSYVSTDYTKNGTWKTLQDASTGGVGLNIVFLGDAYTDRLIEDGTYDADMKRAMDHFFEVEPYASLKDMFNVYQVYAVSRNGTYSEDSSTAFDCEFGSGSLITGYDNKVFMYAQKIDKIKNGKWSGMWQTDVEGELFTYYPDVIGELIVVVVLNSTRYAGTCYMYTDGNAIVYCALHSSDEQFAQAIHHEVGGHAFGRLADEYTGAYSTLTAERKQMMDYYKSYGYLANVDITDDPDNVIWAQFISDDRYSSEVGIYEGAFLCKTGVWRPSENSIMRYNTGGFNAPSREAIYRRAMQINNGEGYEYDFEDFAAFDSKNLNSGKTTKAACGDVTPEADFVPYPEPRIIVVHDNR